MKKLKDVAGLAARAEAAYARFKQHPASQALLHAALSAFEALDRAERAVARIVRREAGKLKLLVLPGRGGVRRAVVASSRGEVTHAFLPRQPATLTAFVKDAYRAAMVVATGKRAFLAAQDKADAFASISYMEAEWTAAKARDLGLRFA